MKKSETYVPDKPCRKGHSLRYVKSRVCVECCKYENKSTYSREYYAERRALSREETRAYNKKWHKTHRENKLLYGARERAKLKGMECDLDLSDIIIPELCPVLGILMTKYNLDRRDNSKGYVKGNVKVISSRANRIKSDATIEEIQAILNYMTLTSEHKTE